MKSYYQKIGYDVKNSKTIIVKNEDLSQNSHIEEIRICDNCGKRYTKIHRAHVITFNRFGEDVCLECVKTQKYLEKSKQKQKQTMLSKYGVEHNSQMENFKEKYKQTSLEKYGVDHPAKSKQVKEKTKNIFFEKYGCFPSQKEEVKEKVVNTNLKKYGVKYSLQNQEVREKSKNTLLEKYGVENPSLSNKIQEKRKNTFLEKYGVENPGQIEEVKSKIAESFYKSGTVKTSKQQLEIYEMIKENFKDEKIELNYPVGSFNLDVVLFIGEAKIDVEYDGWYWHQDKNYDIMRDNIVKRKGYKILRIRSGEKTPSSEELKEKINFLLNSDHSFTTIVLDDWNNDYK